MNVRKRGLALLMCICMIFTLLPFSALADSTGNGNGEAGTGESSEPSAPAAPAATEVPTGKAKLKSDGVTYDSLDLALAAAKDDDTIYLGAGEYSLSTATTQGQKPYEGKNFTFVGAGAEKTKWIIKRTENNLPGDGPCDYSFDSSNSITFEGMTLISGRYSDGVKTGVKTDNYQGFVRINNITLKDCIFNGRADYWGYQTTTFDNVIFNAPGTEASGIYGEDYSLWTWTGRSYTFNKCTFNASGKIINAFREASDGTEENPIVLNFNNCTVISSKPNKSVLNIKDNNNYFKVNINGTNSITGLKPDTHTCSRMFQVQGWADDYNLCGGKGNGKRCLATVNIDGMPVWKDGNMVSHAIDTTNDKYTDGYKDNAFTVEKNGNTVTKTCQYCGWTETKQDWNINVSKTATNLKKDANGDYKTNVTLSVPGVEKNLNSDVVFVLDTSDCVGGVMDQVKTLVEKLKALSSEKKVNIKVGVVAFKGSAAAMFDGELVSVDKAVEDLNKMIADVAAVNTKDEKEAAVVKYLNDNEDFIKKGSNLHSGLLAAQKLLDGDKEVDNDRKYLITVTDGLTYYWNDDQGNVYGIYCGTASENPWGAELVFNQWGPAFGVDTNSGTWKISSDSPIKNWDNYIENVRSRITADNDEYTANVRKAMTDLNLSASAVRLIPRDEMGDFNTAGYSCIPNTELKTHAHGIERSIVACIDTYKQLVTSDYNCYVVNTSTNEFPALVTSELNKLAGQNATIDFNTIENKILYAVDKDS